jgi:hypothetical protein
MILTHHPKDRGTCEPNSFHTSWEDAPRIEVGFLDFDLKFVFADCFKSEKCKKFLQLAVFVIQKGLLYISKG